MFAPIALSATLHCVPRNDLARQHYLDFSQYMSILRSTHASIANGDESFKRNVSLSMFEYYGVMLLWRRLLYVRTELIVATDNIETILPNLAIPKEIGYYLEGIGNITDTNGVTSYLTTLRHLDTTIVGGTHISGSFGKVDKGNHFMYETTPTPFVLLNRIVEDVIFTRKMYAKENPSGNWDLHPQIKPSGGLVPNENLLGWRKAAVLTSEQLAILDALIHVNVNAYVTEWSYLPSETVNTGGLVFIRNILITVSDQLINARSSVHNNYTLGLTFNGSVAQEIYAKRVPYDVSKDLLESRPISVRSATMNCYHNASVHVVSYAAVFRFRFQRVGKIGDEMSPDCLCYSKKDGTAPNEWMENADQVFHMNNKWNAWNFESNVGSDGMTVAYDFSRNIRGIPIHGVN